MSICPECENRFYSPEGNGICFECRDMGCEDPNDNQDYDDYGDVDELQENEDFAHDNELDYEDRYLDSSYEDRHELGNYEGDYFGGDY